jgi:hypothetical protein
MPGAAFAEIVALFTAITATTYACWPKSMAAGILMPLHLGWVAFAAVLNFTIWRMNGWWLGQNHLSCPLFPAPSPFSCRDGSVVAY